MSDRLINGEKQETPESGNAWREIAILALAGGVLLLLSLHYNDAPHGKLWIEAAKDLGLSFIEAALVIAIIDRRASRQQVSESLRLIRKATAETSAQIDMAVANLFDSVYKKNVPIPIVKLYEETAFRYPFFREEHTYECKFLAEPAPEGMVWVSFYQHFWMHNLTHNEEPFHLACETEVLPAAQLPVEAKKKCGFTLFAVDGIDTLPKVTPKPEARASYHAILLSHSEPISARSRKKFEIAFKNLRKVSDFEVVMENCPSDGISFKVDHPQDLEIFLIALHPEQLQPVVDTEDGAKRWTLKAGIMTGQGVCLQWSKKSEEV